VVAEAHVPSHGRSGRRVAALALGVALARRRAGSARAVALAAALASRSPAALVVVVRARRSRRAGCARATLVGGRRSAWRAGRCSSTARCGARVWDQQEDPRPGDASSSSTSTADTDVRPRRMGGGAMIDANLVASRSSCLPMARPGRRRRVLREYERAVVFRSAG
jgi:hypothetical protein